MRAQPPENAKSSPYTYEQMKERQRGLGATGPSGPIEGSGGVIDEDVIDAPAVEEDLGFTADTATTNTHGFVADAHGFEPDVPADISMPNLQATAPSESTRVGAEANTYGKTLGAEAGSVAKKAGKFLVNIPVELAKDVASVPQFPYDMYRSLKDAGHLDDIPAVSYTGLRKLGFDHEEAKARVQDYINELHKRSDALKESAAKGQEHATRTAALAASTLAGVGTGQLLERTALKGISGGILKGALEGGAAGGASGAVTAAGHEKSPGEIATEAGISALGGAAFGGAVGGIHAKMTAPEVGAPSAGPTPVVPAVPAVATAAEPSILDLAHQHNQEVNFARVLTEEAKKYGMDSEDLHKLVQSETPDIQDLAAANQRYGITAQDVAKIREGLPEKVDVPPPPVTGAATPAEGGPASVVTKITAALKAAKPILGQQAKLYSAERGKRIQAAMGAMETAGGGEAGYRAALGQLKGVLPKAEFEAIHDLFNSGEVKQLYDLLGKSKLTDFEKINAMGGLKKLLGTEGVAAVPTNSELSLLQEVYGKDFVEAALTNRSAAQNMGAIFGDVLNAPRSLMTSIDLSAPGRQGLMMITQPEFWKNLGPMVKAFKDEDFFQGMVKQIHERPTYKSMRESGLAITDIDAVSAGEEAFSSKFLNKIPGIKNSARAYTGFLVKLRADVFDRFIKQAEAAGADVTNEEFLKSAAKWINTSTGRGHLPGILGQAAPALNAVLFSPRLAWSRIETFNPGYYMSLEPTVRREALKANLSVAAALGSLLGLTALVPGVKVGVNPLSSDFGKGKIGNTRIDLLGGHQQIMRYASQLVAGKTVSSTTGKEDDKTSRWKIFERFLSSKESPVASYIVGLLDKKNFKGEKFEPGKEAIDRLVPMIMQDTYDAVQEWGPAGLAAVPVAGVGVGIQTYDGAKTESGVSESKGFGMTIPLPDGMKGHVPADASRLIAQQLQEAEERATKRVLAIPSLVRLPAEKADKIVNKVVRAEREKVLRNWKSANSEAYENARATGAKDVDLVNTPRNRATLEAMRAVNRSHRELRQAVFEGADTAPVQERLDAAIQHLQQVRGGK